MKPRIPITDARFKYRNAANTDVRRTWRRARLIARMQERGTQTTTVVSISAKRRHG